MTCVLTPLPDASSFRVLASGVDGVDDRVGEPGVARNCLIAHNPDVHESSVWVDCVVGIVGVMVARALTSLLGGCAEPGFAIVDCSLPFIVVCCSGMCFWGHGHKPTAWAWLIVALVHLACSASAAEASKEPTTSPCWAPRVWSLLPAVPWVT